VPRRLRRSGLAKQVEKLQGMTCEERAGLPGVSESRAAQLLAGAVVAHTALEVLGLDEVSVCPWALREGVILRRLDWLSRT
jgi:exopolyphosphatase/guanosine-5'-triphosphate,3'-diphosphate pyrophosphatase